MSKPKKYAITTLADIFLVPAEKRAAMFKDMAIWLEFCEAIDDKQIGTANKSKFTWIDDGVEGLTGVNLIVSDGTVITVKFPKEAVASPSDTESN
jgi:hypothetical protein